MIEKIKLWIYEKYLEWFYRDKDPDICCCGDIVGSGSSICSHGGCRSLREYTITSAIANYKENKNGKSIRNPIQP